MSTREIDIDKVCAMIMEGKTWQEMAAEFKMPVSTLHDKVNKNVEFCVRARDARERSADMISDMAERVLMEAPKDPIELQRARELAQHYRWKAGKRNPKEYGDRVQQDVTVQELSSRIID